MVDSQVIQIELTPYELEELDKALGSKTREETIKSAINLWISRFKQLTQRESIDEGIHSPRKREPLPFFSMDEHGRVEEYK